jgi:Leucine-rich repeat (LRR) protein
VRSSPAIGSDGTVYVGSEDNKLYALSGKSGVKLWEFETGSYVVSSPAIGSDGTVYVGSGNSKLYAINDKSGVKVWEFETGSLLDSVTSSPAIGSDGTVYVGTFDGKLYAIKTDSKGLAKSPWPMRGQNAQHTGRTIGVVTTKSPEPTPPANSKLAGALINKRVGISIEGDELWIQLNPDGTTLDYKGLTGTFKIENLTLSVQDDDGITMVEFVAPNPKEGDAVTVTGTREPDSPPILGPIKAKLVTLTKINDSGTTDAIPPPPPIPNPSEPEPTKPNPPVPGPSVDAGSAQILEQAIRKTLRKPEGGALTPDDFAKVTALSVSTGLKGPKVKDLTYLKQCPNLQNLFLQSHEVKDLSPLAGLTKLIKINLTGNQVTDLTPLAKLLALKELWLQRNGLANLAPLASLKQLEELQLDENKITDLSPLTGLIGLQVLGLNNNQVENLAPLTGMVQLERLVITGNPAREYAALSGLTALKSLTFSPPPGTDFAAVLGGFQQLTTLSIGKTTLSSLAGLVGALKNPDGLTSLSIHNCGVEDISALSQLKNLGSINLMNNRVTDLSALKGMSRLTSLILSQNKVADLGPLAEVPNLGTLWLSGNRFDDLTPLLGLKKLRTVLIHSPRVPAAQLEQLRKAIPGCRVDNKTASP